MDVGNWRMLLHDQLALARAEPKALRYRLLHVAARQIRRSRRLGSASTAARRPG